MGARSQEALKKRADKRGMTVEEYVKYDREKNKEREKKNKERDGEGAASGEARNVDSAERPAKRQNLSASAFHAASAPATKSASQLGDWTCPNCKFSNFVTRAKCKQCETAAPSDTERQRVLERRKLRKEEKKANVDPSRAWEGTANVSKEKLDDNKRLREQYQADKEALSAEERTRAEALLARDERKRAKKEQRGVQQRPELREKRDAWREMRRQSAIARAPGPPPRVRS